MSWTLFLKLFYDSMIFPLQLFFIISLSIKSFRDHVSPLTWYHCSFDSISRLIVRLIPQSTVELFWYYVLVSVWINLLYFLTLPAPYHFLNRPWMIFHQRYNSFPFLLFLWSYIRLFIHFYIVYSLDYEYFIIHTLERSYDRIYL